MRHGDRHQAQGEAQRDQHQQLKAELRMHHQNQLTQQGKQQLDDKQR